MSKSDCPTVSVTMPVYNAAAYLSAAIESIRTQTFIDLELIIIDDGSIDSSIDIIARHAKSDARIRVLSRENRGIGATRNEAIGMARGRFVAVMDADDVARASRLHRQVAFLAQNEDCAAVGCFVQQIDEDSDPIGIRELPVNHEGIDDWHMTGRGGAIIHPTAMIRRSSLNALGGYRPSFQPAEDYDLFLRLAEIGHLANIPEILVDYRVHASSATYAQRRKQIENKLMAWRDAYGRRGLTLPEPSGAMFSLEQVGDQSHWRRHWIELASLAGNHATALKHAWRLVHESPRSVPAWRALAKACDAAPDSVDLPALPPVMRYRVGRGMVRRTAKLIVEATNGLQCCRQLMLRTPVAWRLVK